MTEATEENHKLELKEFIKLMKMSKGYNWEIKILGNPTFTDSDFKRLKEINDRMINEYGN